MNKKQLLVILSALFLPIFLLAQDLHYSNYDYNPLYLNPAETGGFLGTMRIHASHRDQYDAFIQKGYNTQMVQFDMPLNIKIMKRGWMGYGLSAFTDQAGDLGFKNTGALASLSFHLPLDRKGKQVLALGVNMSRIQRSNNNPENARFGDALGGGPSISSDLQLVEQFNDASSNYGVGITYKNFIDKRNSFKLGTSVSHLLSGTNAENNSIWRRINVYSEFRHLATKTIAIEPRVIVSLIGQAYNINVQTMGRYNYQNRIIFGAGLGYRVADALQILLSVDYQGWDIGLAYDVTVSSASAYNNRQGALELGLRKVFILNKTPKTIPVNICPRM